MQQAVSRRAAACGARRLLIPLPLSYLSVQLVLTAPVPSPALAVLPAIPSLPLGLSGHREASPVSASEQSMHGSFSPPEYIRRVRGLVQKRPTFAGPWSLAV